MSDQRCCIVTYDEDALREKRISLLVKVWEIVSDNYSIIKNNYSLSANLLNEVVEHYLSDVKIIKCRYNIEQKIQLHKIAGLTTALIIRYRPLIPTTDSFTNDPNFIYANELFAITHGLAICGEYSLDICESIAQEEWFNRWLTDFCHLLHCRHFTPESLILVYQTLSHFKFSANFSVEDL
jgi:hypothetical protein